MTREEQQCVWELMTKEIEFMRPNVHALYDEWKKAADALDKLERKRNALWRDWVNEFGQSLTAR